MNFKVLSLLLLACVGISGAIKFVPRGGYQILDPVTGHVLPNTGSRVNFAPPITDSFDGTARPARQIRQNRYYGQYDSLFDENFGFFGNSGKSSQFSSRPHFRKERKVIPYHYQNGARYQPSKVASYAHKKRQQNPYYGRKKRDAEPEPYTLLDPSTGRNVQKSAEKPKRKPFLFGLPFDLFNDGPLTGKVRTSRKSPQSPQKSTRFTSRQLIDPYLSSSGIPLYKYKNKHPLGYGRKKREAQRPTWVLLDPVTGRTLDPEAEQKQVELSQSQLFQDPIEQQFLNPEIRAERQPQYLSQSGVPLYKYRNKYPHGYSG